MAEQNYAPAVPFKMGEIPTDPEAQAKRGWGISVNGEPITKPVAGAVIANNRMGVTLTYGQRPEGYDSFAIREPGGGGAVTIPYVITKTGEILVGVVTEKRPLLGGIVDNVPRGFMDPGDDTHEDAALRELKEETGYNARSLGRRMVRLAQGLNPNTAFFDTSGGPEEGVSIYAVGVGLDELERAEDDNGREYYTFKDPGETEDKVEERIYGSRFVPVNEALTSRDMFTSAAAGHLMGAFFSGELEYRIPNWPSRTPEN